MFTVPDEYVAQFGAEELAERGDWLAALPGTAARYARRWSLREDGVPLYGYVGVVWPVRRADGTPAMLKVSWPHDEATDEAVALATWAGDGTVRLLDHDVDDYVLLLERLDPHHSLNEEPIDVAVGTAGRLLRRLTVPAPPLHRTVTGAAARWVERLPVYARSLGDPVPARMLDAAVDICRELGPKAGSLLVNEDLHYFNVLRGEREPWLLIDPKPIGGDPEFAVIPLLWNRFREMNGRREIVARFDAIVRAAGLDAELARAWTLARAVANWLWSVRDESVPHANAVAGIAAAMIDEPLVGPPRRA